MKIQPKSLYNIIPISSEQVISYVKNSKEYLDLEFSVLKTSHHRAIISQWSNLTPIKSISFNNINLLRWNIRFLILILLLCYFGCLFFILQRGVFLTTIPSKKLRILIFNINLHVRAWTARILHINSKSTKLFASIYNCDLVIYYIVCRLSHT